MPGFIAASVCSQSTRVPEAKYSGRLADKIPRLTDNSPPNKSPYGYPSNSTSSPTAKAEASPNGSDGTYYVQSQTDNAIVYTTRHRRVTHGDLVCNCPDEWAKERAIPCKHILAAEIYESAAAYALELGQRHGLTPCQLESRILYDLTRGVPEELTATRLSILLAAARRLQKKEQER